MKEIKIKDINNIRVGHAQDYEGATGCTVIIAPEGAVAGVDVRGGGPASRETELLRSEKLVDKIHAVTLSGGSAYGLSASDGVMKYLEEKNIGFNVGVGIVPIVCGASLFDLPIGDSKSRPNAKMGYEACINSEIQNDFCGNIGAGTGASVGKFRGPDYMMKGGLGIYGIEIDGLQCLAVVAVNAMGDIYNYENGQIVAGVYDKFKKRFLNTSKLMIENITQVNNLFESVKSVESSIVRNTTIGCVITNAKLTKSQANKLANISHNGLAKVINPVHTSVDGDSIFVMATGEIEVNLDSLGVLSTEVIAKAVNKGIMEADSSYGLISAKELNR